MKELLKLVKKMSNKYPELKEDIQELLQLCFEGIDEGGAEMYEVEFCYDSIKELVNDYKTSENEVS